MRGFGPRTSARGFGKHDHGCLVYCDDNDFLTAGVAYLRDGLELGQRAMYVAGVSPEIMRRQLAELGDVDALVRTGRLELVALDATYRVDEVDVAQQSAVYGAAIDRALADGFTGLRTLAETTPLAAGAGGAESMARWEACADRMMAERPWSALCCYDRRVLADDALGDVAAVHPVSCGAAQDLVSFQLFSRGQGRVALSGSVETVVSDDFERLFDLVVPDEPFELDLSSLEFIDHNGVLAIARRTGTLRAAGGRRIDVAGAPPMVSRVADLIGLQL